MISRGKKQSRESIETVAFWQFLLFGLYTIIYSISNFPAPFSPPNVFFFFQIFVLFDIYNSRNKYHSAYIYNPYGLYIGCYIIEIYIKKKSFYIFSHIANKFDSRKRERIRDEMANAVQTIDSKSNIYTSRRQPAYKSL